MANLSISQAAKTFGISRSTIQRKIKSGELSLTASIRSGTTSAKTIDMSELIRVFGEPETDLRHVSMHASRDKLMHADDASKNDLIQQLKNENSFLKQELERAHQREHLRLTHQTQSWWSRTFGK